MIYFIYKDRKVYGSTNQVGLIDDIAKINGLEEYQVGQTEIEDYEPNNNKYLLQDGEIVLNPNYEAELEQKERERIAKLYLTGADVERGIYKAKGMDFDDIIAFVTANPPQGLDIKALKIELKANNFYRGNPYVSAIGQLLGLSEEQLNLFFKDGNYEHLLPKEEPTETPSEETFNLEE